MACNNFSFPVCFTDALNRSRFSFKPVSGRWDFLLWMRSGPLLAIPGTVCSLDPHTVQMGSLLRMSRRAVVVTTPPRSWRAWKCPVWWRCALRWCRWLSRSSLIFIRRRGGEWKRERRKGGERERERGGGEGENKVEREKTREGERKRERVGKKKENYSYEGGLG